MSNIETAKEILNQNKQDKLLKVFENINGEKKEQLADEILEIDFDKMNKLYKSKDVKVVKCQNIMPINYVNKNKLTSTEMEELALLGKKVIKQNQYAVVTMAGGQGTRLGWKGPKGTFKLDVGENGKYIFEILVDTLKRASKKYGTEIRWYIMTSEDNNKETVDFFEEHNYFGYNKEKVKFFKQGMLPLMDLKGNLLVDRSFNIKQASDGNGGVFKSLKTSGMIDDMKKHHIKWVFIGGVDNIMANMVDNILVGLAIKNHTLAASKAIKKAYPEEKVGSFCKKDGRPAVIEYSEMSKEMIYARDENDELLYGASHIVANLFNIDFLEEIEDKEFKYHCAVKKNSFIDENLKEVVPETENSLKFEAFIFDAFEYLKDLSILRVNRDEEFAPIKNATGNDSPQTAKKIYENYFLKKTYKKSQIS